MKCNVQLHIKLKTDQTMLLYKDKTNHDLPIKNMYKNTFLFKKSTINL